MGIFNFRKNSGNKDIPYIEEDLDKDSTFYKPKDFNKLLGKI